MSKQGILLSVAQDQEGKSPNIITPDFRIPIIEFGHAVARGEVTGTLGFEGFGQVYSAGSATLDIWDGPTATIPVPPYTGIPMEVVSTSAQDGVGGTGVTQLLVYYMDENGVLGPELVVMNGITPVSLSCSNISFIQLAHTYAAGSGKVAAGTISIQSVGGATVYAVVSAGKNRTLSTIRKIPKGLDFYLALVSASGASKSNDSAQVWLYAESMFGVKMNAPEGGIFYPITEGTFGNSSLSARVEFPVHIPELTVVKCQAVFDGAGFSNAHWVGWLEPNT